ncbi:hypothetical protein JRQ81_005227 [Phrynocephalus forsythii]|uniref:Uncharacterized protein n=1 Tax=Phrynocephalus forsythii TaxID=171643 RepID=A0A9Q0Y3S2_9SAUR|nr:hypothetical protein JRQ81_005227 [Phrynocephalus forsythii]
MFLKNASSLAYKEKPKYEALKDILLSGLAQKGASYNGMLDFTATKSIGGGCVGSPRKAYSPKPAAAKQVKEVTESRLENKELAYRRKATVGMKSSQVQEKQMLAGLNKPLQTEVENTEPLQRTYLHKTSPKTEDKCIENGWTFPPVCQPKGFQMLTSPAACINSEPVLHEELYQYLIAIAVLFFLIFLALYFL